MNCARGEYNFIDMDNINHCLCNRDDGKNDINSCKYYKDICSFNENSMNFDIQ